jgi:ACR3 family arsenite efflux pump ArsB
MGAAFLGIVLGRNSALAASRSAALIEVFLMLLLFFVFYGVDIRKITKSFTNIRFSLPALIINFIWTPFFAYALGSCFLRGNIEAQIGFVMLMVTPCTDWYLIFTGLSKGNVPLASSILPLNLILQIILLPFYLLFFFGSSIHFDTVKLLSGIIFVLVIPLTAANITKTAVKKIDKKNTAGKALAKYMDAIQLLFLCLAVTAMFSSQGNRLLDNAALFVKILFPLILFFAVNFAAALFTGKKLKLPREDIIPLIFTTSARNSPIALAIAGLTFPDKPVISLVLVMGPLIELPVLALDSGIIKALLHKNRPA